MKADVGCFFGFFWNKWAARLLSWRPMTKHLDLCDLLHHLDFRVYIIDVRVCFSDAHVLILAGNTENITAYTIVAQCCEQLPWKNLKITDSPKISLVPYQLVCYSHYTTGRNIFFLVPGYVDSTCLVQDFLSHVLVVFFFYQYRSFF